MRIVFHEVSSSLQQLLIHLHLILPKPFVWAQYESAHAAPLTWLLIHAGTRTVFCHADCCSFL